MGHRNSKQQGPKLPVDVHVGVTVLKLRGVNSEQDPAAIQPAQHQHLVNVRINEDGMLVSRGGLEKVTDTPVDFSIRGFWDASPQGHVDQVLNPPPPPAPVVPPAGAPSPATTFSVLRPSAQGNYNGFTAGPYAGYGTPAGYSKWSALADEDMGSYIRNDDSPGGGGADDTRKDSFVMTNLPVGVVSVSKVVVKVKLSMPIGDGRLQNGDTQHVVLGVRLGGVDGFSSNILLSDLGEDTVQWDCTASKPGGGAWSPTDIDNVECVVRTIMTRPNNSSPPRISYLWLEVTYA